MTSNSIDVVQVTDTGSQVSSAHFGGNSLFVRNTDGGVILPEHASSIEALGITSVRYPAGQPDTLYENGMVRDGAIIPEAAQFFDWAQQSGTKVTVVLPTDYGYPGQAEMTQFLNLLFSDYADIIDTVEVGNEYWGHMTEQAYGQVAGEVLDAIMSAEDSTGYDAEVLVQMANPTGRATAFDASYGGWMDRIEAANKAIIDQLSSTHLDQIDGVVEHYYFRKDLGSYDSPSDAVNYIDVDHKIWNAALGRDIPLHITEWNVKTTHLSHQGIRASVSLMEQFGFMMEMGVDEAYVWPPQHNTVSDLAGLGDPIVDPVTGVVINSINGAMFSLMAQNLPGLTLQDTSATGLGTDTYLRVYSSDTKAVIYVGSSAYQTQDFSLDLDIFGSPNATVSGIHVGYDQSTSDGIIWNPSLQGFSEAEYVMLDGARYYLNEHDAQAQVTAFDQSQLGGLSDVAFSLKPYEVMQITVTFPPAQSTVASNGDDAVTLNDDADSLNLLEGNDVVNAGGGDDTIFGNQGDDRLVGAKGNDLLDGGDGADVLSGWGGADRLLGKAGNDRLLGHQDNDELIGGAGRDYLAGHEGDDDLDGGTENDTLEGGEGQDTLDGGTGSDRMIGGAGDDTYRVDSAGDTVVEVEGGGVDHVISSVAFSLRDQNQWIENLSLVGSSDLDAVGNARDNVISGTHGDNVLNGAWGNDTLIGRGGNDTFRDFGGADTMIGGFGNDVYYVDHVRDRVVEEANQGTDTVFASVSYSLKMQGQAIENLTLTGEENLNATGNARKNVITGNNGDNVLDGAWGNDTLIGGAGDDTFADAGGADLMDGGQGNDIYYVDHRGDRIVEAEGNGSDSVFSSISFNLDQHSGALEDLTLTGTGNTHGTGNGQDNVLIGNAGNNLLSGFAGDDVLQGGAGNDGLTGGTGADRFVWDGAAGTTDRIFDFNVAENDRIDLRGLAGIESFQDLIDNHATQTDAGVVLSVEGNAMLELLEVQLDDLSAEQFLFV